LVVVITSKDSGEVVERWQFDVSVMTGGADGDSQEPVAQKPQEEIQKEIQSIIRQITASVTFLPELQGRCTFNVLVYADGDADVPKEWGDSDPKDVKNAEQVQLRSFSTQSHKIDTLVAYKLGDD
jgi:mitotic spindle assembly checkpoint protein MAD2